MHKHEWRLLDAIIQRERVALRPAQIITIHDLSQETTDYAASVGYKWVQRALLDNVPDIRGLLVTPKQCSR